MTTTNPDPDEIQLVTVMTQLMVSPQECWDTILRPLLAQARRAAELEARITTICDEACGLQPVQPADESLTLIEHELSSRARDRERLERENGELTNKVRELAALVSTTKGEAMDAIMDRENLRRENGELSSKLEPLRKLFLECWVCKGKLSLSNDHSMTHCDGCEPTDEQVHEWDEFVSGTGNGT